MCFFLYFLQLALNLGVIGDVQKASTHEDFFAQLSESAIHLMTIRCYTEILEHTKVRLKQLVDSYAELNELYVNHDGIIGKVKKNIRRSSRNNFELNRNNISGRYF